MNIAKFETGKTYTTRSACDYECIFEMKVLSRTEKSLKVLVDGKEKRVKVRVGFDQVDEYVLPYGSYSMAPCFTADS